MTNIQIMHVQLSKPRETDGGEIIFQTTHIFLGHFTLSFILQFPDHLQDSQMKLFIAILQEHITRFGVNLGRPYNIEATYESNFPGRVYPPARKLSASSI